MGPLPVVGLWYPLKKVTMPQLRKEVLILLFALLGGTILASLFTANGLELFGYREFAMDLPSLLARKEDGVGRALLLSQALYTVFMFVIPAVFILQRWQKRSDVAALGQPSWTWVDYLLAIVILPASLPLLNVANEAWIMVSKDWSFMQSALASQSQGANMVERMLFLPGPMDRLSGVLVFVFLAALAEEVLFRGVIQRFLHQGRRMRWAILGGAIAFTLGHLNFVQWPFLLGAGLILGALYALSGRLWLSMVAHVLHNAMTYYWTLEAGPGAYGQLDNPLPWLQTTTFTLAAIAAAYALHRRTSFSKRS